uniref:Uncharacterized protein n=1 Tax=Anopheles atroparvus TaxID=41427 RepID=A0AAG5CT83_ANOAO
MTNIYPQKKGKPATEVFPEWKIIMLFDDADNIIMKRAFYRKLYVFWCLLMIVQIFAIGTIIKLTLAKTPAKNEPPSCAKNPVLAMQDLLIARDIPTIQSLASLPFLNVPTIERTEKGFKVRGRDYEATYERISRADCDDDATDSSAKQVPTKEQPEPDFALTMVKGKTHYWKNRIGKPITLQKIDMHGEIKQKEREASPSGNAIPVDDGTVKM